MNVCVVRVSQAPKKSTVRNMEAEKNIIVRLNPINPEGLEWLQSFHSSGQPLYSLAAGGGEVYS